MTTATGQGPMRYPLPDLFGRERLSVVHALYAVAIPKVLWRGEPAEALRMLRSVRRYARRAGVSARHTAWTRQFELEALLVLGEREAAWRLARLQLRESYPQLASLKLRQRVHRMPDFVRYVEVPAAYYAGRLRHATEAMELYLDWGLRTLDAYEVRFSVFNGDEHPAHHVRVTLFHLYRQAGRTLGEWPRWREWVSRLDPRLLAMCELNAEALAENPALIVSFEQRLRAIEKERRPAFITFGKKDLLEPKRKVLRRQRRVLNARPTRRVQAHAAMIRRKRSLYFPWLESKP